MRSQTNKPVPKKGAQGKTSTKSNTPSKQVKKKTGTPKKVQNLLIKSLTKTCKKNAVKDDNTENPKTADSTSSDKSETVMDQGGKTTVSKPQAARSPSPGKKNKNEGKEKKDSPKSSSDSIQNKNNNRSTKSKSDKKTKTIKVITKITEEESDDVKYKLNSEIAKSVTPKYSKAKTIIKKMPCLTPNKKSPSPIKLDKTDKVDTGTEMKSFTVCNKVEENPKLAVALDNKEHVIENISKTEEITKDTKSGTKANNTVNPLSNPNIITPIETPPKTENERPPKFFTSNRPPRTVDIDVKCCKTTKGNLSMSERFLPMKCVETKTEDSGKDKINLCNNLISQGAEVDVYTFTDKVDSPKSILSGFRSPLNKNVGRVRPIARVKGTVIDKTKPDTEKKKYSPHRPIEEVVKQLKANKKSEEMKFNQFNDNAPTSSGILDTSLISDLKEDDEKPRAIVSKSYKMVARKTSIPGQPYSPIKLLDDDLDTETKSTKRAKSSTPVKKSGGTNLKKKSQKISVSDEDLDECKFSFNTKSNNLHYSSSEESVNESNDDNDTKESSESDTPKSKKLKNKRYKRITDSMKKNTSKELQELSKDSLIDLKEDSMLLGKEKPSKRRLKLFSMWTGPKKHRMASLNALAKVHCLYENESRSHMELGLMKTVDKQVTSNVPGKSRRKEKNKTDSDKRDSTSESEYERKEKSHLESSEEDSPTPNTRTLRVVPGIRSAGKYWDPKSSTSSSEDSELDYKKKINVTEKKKTTSKTIPTKSDTDKSPAKMKKTSSTNVKKKRNRNEVVMDLKDMVVQKRMASLNATAILAASYEKRSPKSSKDDSTSDSCSDESFTQKPKNGGSSGVKSETKNDDPAKKESDETVAEERKQKVEVIVNQDTDVTITGVYSTHHHEGFCTVSGMQYRISSTSHTQTTATANCDKEGCTRDEGGARYTPLSALSSMQPPADQAHAHSHPEQRRFCPADVYWRRISEFSRNSELHRFYAETEAPLC
ncbi:hypothetical protein EVAR_4042_1 [Eumeta japonica]|uniref:Uncharacterized protein n=1 Tax=Eumeta variegata TaxID=151549 RepID=A0A4C1T6F3_EUMVA|nr:hypothetical protein EVAR_4042_1 [Eumeta japonica]